MKEIKDLSPLAQQAFNLVCDNPGKYKTHFCLEFGLLVDHFIHRGVSKIHAEMMALDVISPIDEFSPEYLLNMNIKRKNKRLVNDANSAVEELVKSGLIRDYKGSYFPTPLAWMD